MLPGRRRLARPRWIFWLLGIAAGLLALLVLGVVAVQQPSIATGLVNAVLGRFAPAPRAKLSVARVSGDWLTHLEIRGVRLARGDTLLASVDTLRVRHRWVSLLTGRLRVTALEVGGVIVTADIADTTRPTPPPRPLTLADLLRGRFYGGPTLRVDRFVLRDARYGGRAGAPDSGLRLVSIAAEAHDVRLGRGFAFVLDTLALHALPRAQGEGARLGLAASLEDGRLDARSLVIRGAGSALDASAILAVDRRDSIGEGRVVLHARPLALADLAALAPGLDVDGAVTADVDVHGTRLDRASGSIAASAERVRVGDLAFATTRLDGTFADGRADAKLVTRYEGSRAAVSGWIRPFDAAPTYDLDARADRLPARLPGLAWWPAFAKRADAAVTLRVEGSGYARPRVKLVGRAEGSSGRVDLDGALDLTNGLGWTVNRLAFEDLDIAHLAGDTTASSLTGTLTGTGQGAGAKRRMATALTLGPSRYGAWRIDRAHVRARARGADVGGALAIETDAGALQIDSLVARWDKSGTFRVLSGRFHDVDLARVTHQTALASRLDGTLSAQGHGLAALAGPGGATAAMRDGRFDADVRVALAPSTFRGQTIDHGETRLTLAGGTASLTGVLTSPAGRLALDGRAQPFDAPPSAVLRRARFEDVDLAAWSGVAALRSRLSGTLTGEGHPAATNARETWSVALDLDPSRLGHADLDGGEARAEASGGEARITAAVRMLHDTLAVRGDVTYGDGTPRGHADVTIPMRLLAAVAGRESLSARGALVARTTFEGLTPATAVIEGSVSGGGAIDRARLDSLLATVRLARGTLTIDTLSARSGIGAVTGSGRIALFDTSATAPSELNLHVDVRDAAPLRALLRADTLATGGGTLDVRITGPTTARRVEVTGALRSLAWNQNRVLGADGTITAVLDRGWRPISGRAQGTLRRFQGAGVALQEAQARVTLEHGATDFDVDATIDDQHRAHVAGRSTEDSLGTHVALATLDVQAADVAWALAHPTRIDLARGRYAIHDFVLQSSSGRVTANGHIDRRGEQDLAVDLRGVGVDVLSAWVGRPGVSGTLDGMLALTGPAAAPKGHGNVRLALLSDGDPAGTLVNRLAWDGTRLDLDGSFSTPKSDSLAWKGHLPLAVSLEAPDSGGTEKPWRLFEGDVDVRVTADRFPLQALSPLLEPRAVGSLQGMLDVDASLKGSSQALAGSGRVDVANGVAPLPGLGVTYSNIEVHGEFQGNRLVLRQAHATSGKGSLDGPGEIRFVSATRIEPKLHVTARKFAFVLTTDLRAIGTGEVDVTGTLAAPVVKGKTTVRDSYYYVTQTDLAAAQPGSTVRLSDADVRMMEETFGYVKAAPPNLGLRFYDASDLDLAIRLEGNNWVRQRVSPKMSVALTGDFHLLKAPHAEPELYGRIEPVPNRGYVEQFARSFDIVDGEVLLNGKMKDHTVDIQAQYKPPTSSESTESDITVNLEVTGTTEKLALTLSSEPAMSEAEIVSYIATGHSVADKPGTTSNEQASSLARDIGLSQVTGVAEEAAQEAIGLDVLQVRFDPLQGATLVAGRYVDPQLYIGFRQPLQYKDTGSPSTETTYKTSFEVEYAIYRWLVLNLQGETSKLRSFIRARYAY
jgi:autotransporter translocation and assembly factor TamB